MLYLRCKLFDIQYQDFWPVYLFENVEMAIICDDVLGIGSYGAVNKLVVIDILLYQSEMDISLLELGGM